MKIGDKVRFLSETGGGRISGFQGKNIVLVEDEDGFEIPTPINEVVVVTDDDYSSAHLVEAMKKNEQHDSGQDNRSIRQRLSDTGDGEANDEADDFGTYNKGNEEDSADDPSVNFTPKPRERKDGDKLSVYLAFVPMDIKNLSNTQFESYIINDSNYFVTYTYMTAEGNSWTLRSTGEIEPNTKLFIEKVGFSQFNDLAHAAIQLIAYKREKPFLLKPAVDVQFRIDAVKFFKLHAFKDNDFFDIPALLYTVIENDRPVRPLVVDSDTLKQEMFTPDNKDTDEEKSGKSPARVRPVKVQTEKEHHQSLVRRYESNQSKSRNVKQVLNGDKIVVDLHADELLDTTAGMSSGDILEYQLDVFRRTLEQYKDKKGQKLIFIHGKGEGILRHAIIHELNYKYKKYQYQDASFQEYGYGATQVTIR